jgi:hypothetical protein
MMKRVLIVLLGGLLSFPAMAKSKSTSSSLAPHDIVQKYLAADFSGSRVFKDDKAATTQLVTWTEEPPWDQIIIVGHYAVTKTKTKRKIAKVGVKYSNLGELKGDLFFADPASEETTFETVRRGHAWRLDRPILVPHISVSTAEKYLRDQQKSLDPNSERAKTLEKTIQTLHKF